MEYIRLLKRISPCMTGDDVLAVQTELKGFGLYTGELDGKYGPKTESAVEAFQELNKLKKDGIVGPITWAALFGTSTEEENSNQEDIDNKQNEVDEFATWVDAQIGCLYVWGAQGEQMTPELIKKLENSNKNYNRAMASYNEHVAKGLTLIGYDCSGLVVKYLLDHDLISYDTTANGLYYNQCDAIDKSELRTGDLVFKKKSTSSKIYHVGVYMGDGTVVHAKGRDYGVVRESIDATNWNRFGRLKVFANVQASQTVQQVYTRALKRTSPNMRGDDVRAVQEALIAKGYDPKGVDGAYGKNTVKAVKAYQKANGLVVDGIVGEKTWASLIGA